MRAAKNPRPAARFFRFALFIRRLLFGFGSFFRPLGRFFRRDLFGVVFFIILTHARISIEFQEVRIVADEPLRIGISWQFVKLAFLDGFYIESTDARSLFNVLDRQILTFARLAQRITNHSRCPPILSSGQIRVRPCLIIHWNSAIHNP